MKHLMKLYLACSLVIGISDLSIAADIYPDDSFSLHKFCIDNPWNGTNYKGATSSFPCKYNYAIIHVPTHLSEIAQYQTDITSLQTQVATLQAQLLQQTTNSQVVSLELLGINSQTSLIAFGFGFVAVITFWSIGFIASIIRSAGNLIR
jgi:hypothetical protein